jgi:A/G-specific adenine glycosylase
VPKKNKSRASWRRIPGVVTHVFTHFPLELIVYTAAVPAKTGAPKGMRWVALDDLADEALPNVMRKVVAHALDNGRPRRGSLKSPRKGTIGQR